MATQKFRKYKTMSNLFLGGCQQNIVKNEVMIDDKTSKKIKGYL